MSKEDKCIILQDLTARLPYGVILDYSFIEGKQRIHTKIPLTYRNIGTVALDEWHTNEEIFKPYLRPLSSMTEEEKKELLQIIDDETRDVIEQLKNNNCGVMEGKYHFNSLKEFDWLNANHFAYRTLNGKDMFELGLAIEAPKGMYK